MAVTGTQFTVWHPIGDDTKPRSYTAETETRAAELRAVDDYWTSQNKIHWPIAYRVRNDVNGSIWIVVVNVVPQPSFRATHAKELPMEPGTHILWRGRTLCLDLRLRGVPRDWPADQRWLSLNDALQQTHEPPDRCKECWFKLDTRIDEDIDLWNRAHAENYNAESEDK